VAFFYDTNLCSTASRDAGVMNRLKDLSLELQQANHAYVACPLVLLELIEGLAKPEPTRFHLDKRRFLTLAGPMEGCLPRYLPYPGTFVMKTLFGVPSAATRFAEADFGQWHGVISAALDRGALMGGSVDLFSSKLISYGLNPSIVAEQQQQGRQAHAESFEHRRRNRIPPPTPEQFAAVLMRSQGVLPQSMDDLKRLAVATDAAYHYEVVLNNLALAGGYDFAAREHAGDWIDSQLLLYLADPEMLLVTLDRKLRNRVQQSPEAARIIVL
jgi:hypothetical protein